MSQLYTIKLLEQDLVRKSAGVYFSLNEPLKYFGKASNDKLVLVATGKFTDDQLCEVRKHTLRRYVDTMVDFTLERINIKATCMENGKAVEYTLQNQHDPTVPHKFKVCGQLDMILRSIRNELVRFGGLGVPSFITTIEPIPV